MDREVMHRDEPLKSLTDAARAPLDEWPARYPDRRAVGYLCSYVPEEMIHAAGLVPVRVRGNAEPLRQVDAHLQSFTCALCRSTLDQLLAGKLAFMAGTVFAHTCDALQAQADLWRINAAHDHRVTVVMQPAHLGTPAARPYLVAELARFRDRLGEWAGQPVDDEALHASIVLYDETRRLVQSLGSLRGRLSAAEAFAVLDAAHVVPRELFNPMLVELLSRLEDAPERQAGRGAGLFLTGALLDEPRLLDVIDDLGAAVVGDDLCTGSRHFFGQVGADGEPLSALAEYYLTRPPCPAKYHPVHDPARHVVEQARAVQAGGVVFVVEKFCEPHAFDYALSIPALDEARLPHLMLEMEQTPSLEALRTRLEAFVEML
ncbi:MAG: 2-hydroxyacyl-CoA dehydratase [Anaerolineae bacterium]|nr:2-hydroxyacyl-CoA dehydratase [Anaerolineae bacterium]